MIMPDYKKLYLKQFRANEKAVQILIDAQRECEDLFMEEAEMEDVRKTILTLDDIKKRRLK